MRKILLALFVIAMLGYSAVTVYFVFGFAQPKQESVTEEQVLISEEETLLADAYAQLEFSGLAKEYQQEDGMVNEALLEKIAEAAREESKLEAAIAELQLEGYTAQLVSERIILEAGEEKATAKLMVVDPDQYTAADLCSAVLVILDEADLSDVCAEMKVGSVGTEVYPSEELPSDSETQKGTELSKTAA